MRVICLGLGLERVVGNGEGGGGKGVGRGMRGKKGKFVQRKGDGGDGDIVGVVILRLRKEVRG